MPNTTSKASIFFIFVTVLIDVIGFGIIIPVLPPLLQELTNLKVNEVSIYGGYLLMAFAIPQFIFSPLWGNVSDRFGRRPIILLSLFGFSIDYLLLAVAPTYWWLIIGRVIAGFFGASFTTASAYIADISTADNRSKNFGLLGAAFGMGFVIGPLLGGILGSLGTRVPFYTAAGLTMVNFLYGLFVLPESLAADLRRPFDWRRANPVSSLKQLNNYKGIGWLLIAYTLLSLGSHAVSSNWTFFTSYKFGWGELIIGISLAVVGIVSGGVQAVLSQKAANTLGLGRSVYIGFGLYTIGMILFGLASSTWMMMLFIIPYCLGGIAMPNLQAYMVDRVAANEQGELQGGLTSLQSLTTIFGPVMMTGVFTYFTSDAAPITLPGVAFYLGALLMAVSWWITYRALR